VRLCIIAAYTTQNRTVSSRILSSHIDLHTHSGSAFVNHVTLTFGRLTSGSIHAERLSC